MPTTNNSSENSNSVNLDNAPDLKELRESTLFDKNTLGQYRSLLKDDDGEDSLQTLIMDAKELLDVFVSLNPFDPSLLKHIKKDLIESINTLLQLNTKWEEVISEYKRLERQGNLSNNSPLADEFFSVTAPKVVSALTAEVPEFLSAIQMAINSLLITKFNRSRLEIDELEQRISNVTKEIEEKNTRADELVKNISMLPTKQQISSFSEMFGKESQSFKDAAKWWIWGVFGCLVGIVGASVYYSTIVSEAEFAKYTVNQIIQFNLTKVLTISALLYGLAICNKNYKSSKHNQILNKHRENALASFQAFVQVPTADNETKNAVLLEATRTIFSAQQTGYVATETDDSPNKIIEIIKTIQEKG